MSTAKHFGMNTMHKDNHETRIALLEQSTNHIVETLREIKTDIKEMRADIKENYNSMNIRFDHINAKIDSNNKWLITTFITAFFALVGTIVSIVNFFIHT
jgi:hypothetical protein